MAVGNVVGNIVGNVVGNLVSGGFDPAGIFGSDLIAWYRGDNVVLSKASYTSPLPSDASWTKVRLSVTSSTEVDPDGGATGVELTSDATAASTHRAHMAQTNQNASYPTTYNFYCKYVNHPYVYIGADNLQGRYFNLQTGAVGSAVGTNTATITDVGGGWYLCSVVSSSFTSGEAYVYIANAAGNAISWSPAGTEKVLVWGREYTHATTPMVKQWRVSQLTDLSGRGNHVTQATSANQPTWSPSSVDFLGQPVATFIAASNTRLGMTSLAVLAASSKPTISVVGRISTLGNRALVDISDSAATNRYQSLFRDGANMRARAIVAVVGQVDADAAMGTTTKHLFESSSDNTQIISTVDNTSTATAYGATRLFVNTPSRIMVGALEAGTVYPHEGDIAEVVVTSAARTAAQVSALKSYFNGRYSLGLTP